MSVNVPYHPCGRKPHWDVWACLNCDVNSPHRLKKTKQNSWLKASGATPGTKHFPRRKTRACRCSSLIKRSFNTNDLTALAPPISVNPLLSETFWAAGNKNLSNICSTGASNVTADVFTALQLCLHVIKSPSTPTHTDTRRSERRETPTGHLRYSPAGGLQGRSGDFPSDSDWISKFTDGSIPTLFTFPFESLLVFE